MADLRQPEPPTNGAPLATASAAPTAASSGHAPAPQQQQLPASGIVSKRQRRPSVRLGEIGEQPASAIPLESYIRRCKQFNVPIPHHFSHPHKEHAAAKASSKTRALTNLVSEECGGGEGAEVIGSSDDRGLGRGHSHGGGTENLESLAGIRRGGRDGKTRGGGVSTVRRVRSNWVSSKVEEGMECSGVLKLSGGEDAGDDGNCRESDDLQWGEDSGSPLKEHSVSDRVGARVRLAGSKGLGHPHANAMEINEPSETNGRDWNDKPLKQFEDGGVRSWLNGLGLGRYTPVFEIHEVDDEVLPLLTQEDLKDMGINAVGSRRKMYSAILKLRRNLP